MGAVLHTFFLRRVFMMEDFPVLGYPINPTEICFLFECKEENCRSKVIKDPLPNEFVKDAWNANVGYSVDNCFTHFAYN